MMLGSEPSAGAGAGIQLRPAGSLSAFGGAELGVPGRKDTTSCVMALPSLSRRGSTGRWCPGFDDDEVGGAGAGCQPDWGRTGGAGAGCQPADTGSGGDDVGFHLPAGAGAGAGSQAPGGGWADPDRAARLRPDGLWEPVCRIEGRPRISGGRGGRLYRVASMKPALGSERRRCGAPGSESRKVPAGTDEPIEGSTTTGGSVSAMPVGAGGIEESARGKEPDTSLCGGSELRLPTPSNGAT